MAGRGDGDSWAEVRARAEAQFNSSSPGYLEAKKPLADYLIRGICVLARGRDGAP